MKAASWNTDVALIAVVIVAGGITGWFVLRRADAPPSNPRVPTPSPQLVKVATPPPDSSTRTVAPNPPIDAAPSPAAPPRRKGKPPIWDFAARDALKRVGSDPEAERYWLSAINNPALPETERQDLIEDLNEDGLSDPRQPGVIDLPLINARIRLIEQLMPEAMDRVNADAFKEALKDLTKMRAKLDG
jgi:hypothetical protein